MGETIDDLISRFPIELQLRFQMVEIGTYYAPQKGWRVFWKPLNRKTSNSADGISLNEAIINALAKISERNNSI